MAEQARLDHVGLAVAGLEAAAAWFCDVFGLVRELSLRVDALDLSMRETALNRILFTGGKVFDGTGAPAVPADVVVRGDRIESVRPGGGTEAEPGRAPRSGSDDRCRGWRRYT